MTYKINDTELPLQPTEGRWVEPDPIGIGGNGFPRYPAIRSFELSWDYLSASELYVLQSYFDSQNATGTISVDLPEYRASSYVFKTYSGCTMYSPQNEAFFQEYTSGVILLIDGIRI